MKFFRIPILAVCMFMLLAVFNSVFAESSQPPQKIPDFRYPVNYEKSEGVLYSVGSPMHEGADQYAIDFVYPEEGMDVFPTLPGRVVYAGCLPAEQKGYGCVVVIRSWDDKKWDQKYYSLYAHLQPGSIEAYGIKVADIVDGSKPIGRMGRSGQQADVHLHFAVRVSDEVYEGTTALYGQVNRYNVITPAFNVRPYLR